jgi:hypothetical protein
VSSALLPTDPIPLAVLALSSVVFTGRCQHKLFVPLNIDHPVIRNEGSKWKSWIYLGVFYYLLSNIYFYMNWHWDIIFFSCLSPLIKTTFVFIGFISCNNYCPQFNSCEINHWMMRTFCKMLRGIIKLQVRVIYTASDFALACCSHWVKYIVLSNFKRIRFEIFGSTEAREPNLKLACNLEYI